MIQQLAEKCLIFQQHQRAHPLPFVVPNVYVDCVWTAQSAHISARSAHTLLSHHHLEVVQLP
jgi:hypothetical protein